MKSLSSKVEEGKIPFSYRGDTYETWYKIVGEIKPGCIPLVVLHGGPGVSHDYLLPLTDLVSSSRAVIFYDQIGVGHSKLPESKAVPTKTDEDKGAPFFTFDLFITELEALLAHFHISDGYDLIGHSWGGILGVEFAIRRQPAGLKHLILTNTLSSFPIHREEVSRLRALLPQDIQDTMAKHEKEGTTDSAEYKHARMAFFAKFACTVQPFPQLLLVSLGKHEEAGHVVEAQMFGGDLKDWDVRDRLHLVNAPTLVINGENDYMTDAVNWPFFNRIPKVKWVKFAQSSHMPFYEEKERYMRVVDCFLQDGNTGF